MKSKKYVIMRRIYVYGVYSNEFVKHVELYDSNEVVEFTRNPNEAAIFYGRELAYRYAKLLNAITYGRHITFFVNKIGRCCKPNAYLVYSHKTDEGIVYRFRDRAESALDYLKPFKARIYPIYGFVGKYDY